MKLLLPTNVPLDPALPDGVVAVGYDVREPIPQEHLDAAGLVVWANRNKALAESVARMPALRWLQALSAGTEHLLRMDISDGVIVTSGVGLHDKTVTEHTLALTLSLVRRLPQMAEAQVARRWDRGLGGVQPLYPEGSVTTLLGARVLVWGFGSIAKTLAPVLASLGAQVRGVARSAGERAGFEVIADSALEAALPETDILIMVLPSTPWTANALNAQRLALLPDHAYVINVGRGATVDEDDLVAALETGTIAGAAADVTAVEPLPEDSPLWHAPNMLISPHAAGGRPVGSEELISANVAALLEGRELRNVVDR